MVSAAFFFYAATTAVFNMDPEFEEVSCDELRVKSRQVYAGESNDVLRVRVIRARNLGIENEFSEPYALMEYETYKHQTIAVQKKRIEVAQPSTSPDWAECGDIYFPTDFLIEDSENDLLRISVYGPDLLDANTACEI